MNVRDVEMLSYRGALFASELQHILVSLALTLGDFDSILVSGMDQIGSSRGPMYCKPLFGEVIYGNQSREAHAVWAAQLASPPVPETVRLFA